ncbi:TKL family protein kinase [Histomonas meleagridis]|uniref:TKL family protein kinase n=1 Tax=Histomonas meleagridis TaxID=135588 RepID=UPI00355A5C24|nr:TKL family protein kinase [Histomonas meleagridis]KAH0801329.1 TKL family protein kinase [Histomonas meleagridis]
MAKQVTMRQLVSELQGICAELEGLAHQTVAHRRKFIYACHQFRQFVEIFGQNATDDQITQEQFDAYKTVINNARAYQKIFAQNMMQCWAVFALENKSSTVAMELCQIASNLKEATSILDLQASLSFDPKSNQWLQYHILDLRAISASFSQYNGKADPDDPTFALMKKRLDSINNFIKQFRDATPGNHLVSPIPIHYQSWRVNISDFQIIKEIGTGVSANVYFGIDKRTGKHVAIKKLKFNKLTGTKLQSFQRELSILASADHPTLLKFVGATETVPYCIITEWMPNKSLYQDLHKNHRLDDTMLTIALFDIARGMRYLHARQIIHRDLKSLNVLLDENYLIRICDFGFSRKAANKEVMTKNVGTPHWMAPELLNTESGYDNKIDVYAYAIVCWECIAKALPYGNLEPTQIIAQVLVNDIRPPIPPTVPGPLRSLITECWSRDPTQRPTFSQIVRRFKRGDIYLEHADRSAVMRYIVSVSGDDVDDDEADKSKLFSKPLFDDAGGLIVDAAEEFVDIMESEGIPFNLLSKCWEFVQQIDVSKYADLYRRGMAAFIPTPNVGYAAKALRALPHDSLPPQIITSVIAAVPTGNADADRDLIIIACKNGFAADAALHAIQKENVKLSLEVAGQRGVPPERVEEVTEICKRCLLDEDPMLNVAALRCLISMKKAHVVEIDTLRVMLQSKNGTLRLASHVAAAEMVKEGVVLPMEMIDMFITRWQDDPLAAAILIATCSRVENARHLMDAFTYGSRPQPEIAMRLLRAIAAHQEMKERVAEVAKGFMEISMSTELHEAFEKLVNKE